MNSHTPKSIFSHITLLTILLFFTVISVGWAQSQQTKDDGGLEYKPWLHELTAEQALSAEVGKNKLIFPKEGNSWLSNVEQYHVLWSKNTNDFNHNFALRVLKINESSGNVTFQTARVGFPVVFSGFRDEVKEEASIEFPGEPTITIRKEFLVEALPVRLPGLPTRGFIGVNETEKTFNVVYSGVDGVLQLTIGRFNEEYLNNFKMRLKRGMENPEVTEEPYHGGTLMIGQLSSATKVLVDVDFLDMWLRFSYPTSVENVHAILKAINKGYQTH